MTTEKAPDAFRTISEAAEDLDLPQHVLRFWETRFPQIKPLKRGGGRRYYRPDDIEFLKGLKHLLHAERYTIKGVQKIIREQGVKAIQGAWKRSLAPSPSAAAPSSPRIEPPVPGPAAAPLSGPSPVPGETVSMRRQLEMALAELAECRRVVAHALRA